MQSLATPSALRPLLLLAWVAALVLSNPAAALVLPPDGVVLTQLHLQFEWPVVASATDYDIQVVEDDAGPDPFASGIPVVNDFVASAVPRTVVTGGLAFGTSYAWRARGYDGTAMPWGPTYRFQIAAIPANFPTFAVTNFGGAIQPGLTLFGFRDSSQSLINSYVVAVEETGDLVWYLPSGVRTGDARLLDSGRILFSTEGDAREYTLNGQLAWQSPTQRNLHHELFPMPNGDVLTLESIEQEVEYEGETRTWQGDRILVVSREDNSNVWSWSAFDHLSTDDIDENEYGLNEPVFDWTHANAVIFDEPSNSIYISVRHLSRIVQIDYATGAIIYSMGFDMPSGDTDFGDNLFSWQHAPELQPNGNLLLYDNGNRRDHAVQTQATGVTKAIELSFTGNPPASAAIAWEWTVPTYNGAVGDADRLANGNTLVVAGRNETIHEVDASGSEVWRVVGISAVSGKIFFYRAGRIDSLIVDVPGDTDGDGLADAVDNCPDIANIEQVDTDDNDFGDVCEIAYGFMDPPPNLDPDLEIPTVSPVALGLLAISLWGIAATALRRKDLDSR